MQSLRIGNRIAESYLLEEQIGDGRMSSVYQALDLVADGTLVAVTLLDTQHPDPIKQENFKCETVAPKQLRHLNIVSLQQSGWSDTARCFYHV